MPKKHVIALHLVIDGVLSLNFQFLGLTLNEHLNWKGHIN